MLSRMSSVQWGARVAMILLLVASCSSGNRPGTPDGAIDAGSGGTAGNGTGGGGADGTGAGGAASGGTTGTGGATETGGVGGRGTGGLTGGGGLAGTGGASGTVCTTTVIGCCYADTDCGAGAECVGATCGVLGGPGTPPVAIAGKCKTRFPAGSTQCWQDADCTNRCAAPQVCRCGDECLVADRPGMCGS